MTRPRLLLVPDFTELTWDTIRPQLAEWAELASYDPPGVGAEPIADDDVEAVRAGTRSLYELIARRGLEEVERRGWSDFFVVADGWGIAAAARIARERPGAVRGIALGHALLSYEMEGDRPAVNREVWAGMRQLLRQNHREFIRHGIVQMTRGSVSDEVAAQMVARFPNAELVELTWESVARETDPPGDMLKAYGGPLLLAQHVGCIIFTEDGFDDAVEAFPGAPVVRVPDAPSVRPEFVDALRDFCGRVAAQEERAGAGDAG